AVRIAYHLAVACPGESRDRDRIVELFQEVENELLAVAAADKIHLRALLFHQGRVQGREYAAEGESDFGIDRANLTGENLGVGITGRAEKTQPHQLGLPLADLIYYDFVRGLGIGLIEQHAFMSGSLEHRGQR